MYFWGRELTLQGAGKSWVGVLPSSNLGLVVGGRGKADVEKLGVETETEDGSAASAAANRSQLLKPSPVCSLPDEALEVKGIPRLFSPPLLRSVLVLSKKVSSKECCKPTWLQTWRHVCQLGLGNISVVFFVNLPL